MKNRFLLLALLLASTFASAQITDKYVGACASQPACTLERNVSWANGNQVWRFTAWQQNESMRVWILNHNPTSAHTSQSVQIWITDDSGVSTLLQNADRWVQACVVDNSVLGAKLSNVSASNPTASPGANGKGTGYTVGMFAVQVAVRIIGAAGAAGNPDTFDIGVVQQSSTYPGGPQPGCDSQTAITGSQVFCNQIAGLNFSASGVGETQIISLTAGKSINICSVIYAVAVGTTMEIDYGTGSNCGTGTTELTGQLPNNVTAWQYPGNSSAPIIAPVGQAVCVNLGANSTGSITVIYTYV